MLHEKWHIIKEPQIKWIFEDNLGTYFLLLMWSPLLRDQLFKEAFIFGSLEPRYSVNEPI